MNQFFTFWQNLPSMVSPIALDLFGLEIRWYGLMYLLAFATTYVLMQKRVKNESEFKNYDKELLIDLMTWMVIGLLIGARLGYAVFYNFEYFSAHPLSVVLPFTVQNGEIIFTGISGMSFHGGLIGVVIGAAYFLRKKKKSLTKTIDLVIPAIPLGYTFGRVGNFLNGELYGRTTENPFGMHFDSNEFLRHPSQLYEAFFEGIILFFILWSFRKWQLKNTPQGSMLALYLILYGLFRFFIEFVREPDSHLGLLTLNLSMGQILCILMMIAGVITYFYLAKNESNKKHT